MGSSSTTTSNTISKQQGESKLIPLHPENIETLEQSIKNAFQQWNATRYQAQNWFTPLVTQMATGEGMGEGKPYLENMGSGLASAYNLLGQVPGYVQQGAEAMNYGLPALLAGQNWLQGTAEDVYGNVAPIAAGDRLASANDPYLNSLLSTIQNRVANEVGGQFAAAGRDFSGAYSNAMAKGLSEGMAQPLFDWSNQRMAEQLQANQLLQSAGYGAASGYGDIASQLGNLGTQWGNLGGILGNVAGGFGDIGGQYGNLAQLYDQLAMNKYNVGTQGMDLLNSIANYGWLGPSMYANLLLPIESAFGESQWEQAGQEKQRSSTSTSMFSDRKMKRDVEQVGTLFDGTPVYRYRWMDGPMQIGLMADEVIPEATHEGPLGLKLVDYEKATAPALKARK